MKTAKELVNNLFNNLHPFTTSTDGHIFLPKKKKKIFEDLALDAYVRCCIEQTSRIKEDVVK